MDTEVAAMGCLLTKDASKVKRSVGNKRAGPVLNIQRTSLQLDWREDHVD